ncbi:alkaline phosphatase [Sediminispirochaeta smaragdinae]|uniref:Alkaline phosphatase n=1 Tax=Sediminispirochaeta smaragdinae (strain DSM 11293 / JCM 15392 / SEBR 4228) TaxID=573413 RepID=E1R9Q5_SEDSS|nr:alkaline phosphatase [Sediminispirochaeta smaragdinae]ADK83224.1 Alkaline phosphatase [Sediminispirochaeta smaragdinae DSM 11293]
MTRMKRILALTLSLLVSAALFAGGNAETVNTEAQTDQAETARAKYVFFFIGDGMALPQINAAEALLGTKDNQGTPKKLTFSKFPVQGLTTTYAANAFITDSAAAGTALATGHKTNSGVISMDPTGSTSYKTLAEMAKEAGMKVGIVSSVNLDHATPAVFYAHKKSRSDYYAINVQMAESNFDYFGGGMVRIDKTPAGEKSAHDIMKERGFVIASDREQFNAMKPEAEKQYYAYNTGFAANALDYTIDMDSSAITLAEFTQKGIELLDNDKGFFMMVEGGKIDWACHANDAAASIYDTIAFDQAIQKAVDFYNRHPNETLIVVTGDHETGGLSLGFAGTQYDSAFDEIAKQKKSFEWFDTYVLKPYKENKPNGSLADLMPKIEETFGLTDLTDYETAQLQEAFTRSMGGEVERPKSQDEYLLYGGYEPLSVTITHLLNQRAGIAWASYSHTGVPVATFALGASSGQFNGYYDNTDIFTKLSNAMFAGASVAMAR